MIFAGIVTKTKSALIPRLYHHAQNSWQVVVKFAPFSTSFSAQSSGFRPHLITQMLPIKVWWLAMVFLILIEAKAVATTTLFVELRSRIFTMRLEEVV